MPSPLLLPPHSLPLPAPLLHTRKAQLPSLPHPLTALSLPPSTTPLLHLPLSDWHLLNPHTALSTPSLLASLSLSIAQFCGLPPTCITILAPRAASSATAITAAPGSSMAISVPTLAGVASCRVPHVAALHRAMRTHFVAAPSDHPPLHVAPTRNALRKRARRADALQADFARQRVPDAQQFMSIGGAGSEELRRDAARAVVGAHPNVVGYSIEGLYAGEAPEVRERCIRAVVAEIPDGKVVMLAGCSGIPEEVVMAVGCGVHIIPADYPFENASAGYAVDIGNGGSVNVRDRRWETDKSGLMSACECYVCSNYSRGYVRHLWETHEMMAYCLVAMHNLYDYYRWFEKLREAVQRGDAAWHLFVTQFEACRDALRVGKGHIC